MPRVGEKSPGDAAGETKGVAPQCPARRAGAKTRPISTTWEAGGDEGERREGVQKK